MSKDNKARLESFSFASVRIESPRAEYASQILAVRQVTKKCANNMHQREKPLVHGEQAAHHAFEEEIVRCLRKWPELFERARIVAEHLVDQQAASPFAPSVIGRVVREAWVNRYQDRPDPKPTHLLPYDDLDTWDKETDDFIGAVMLQYILLQTCMGNALRHEGGQETPLA